jgi:hypothetical protein
MLACTYTNGHADLQNELAQLLTLGSPSASMFSSRMIASGAISEQSQT